MSENPEALVYGIIGEDGFEKLTLSFYRRVQTDDLLGPMYPPDQMEPARLRLREFLIYRFGGPQRYIAARGHPRLRARHAPFTIDDKARDRWVKLMDESLAESNLHPSATETLRHFFHTTATFLINHSPPPGTAGFAGNPHFPVREQ